MPAVRELAVFTAVGTAAAAINLAVVAIAVPLGLAPLVANVVGFTLNEATYAGALTWTSLDYRLALFLVIVALATAKLLASKYWAFARA